jgi:hypothetical protein
LKRKVLKAQPRIGSSQGNPISSKNSAKIKGGKFIPKSPRRFPSKRWSYLRLIIPLAFLLLVFGILSCETQKEIKPNSNRPPIITSANILPEKPWTDSELNLIIQSTDPDGDPVAYQYQWVKNGKEIMGEKKSVLKNGTFKKGNIIEAKITPSDGKVEGQPYRSPQVRIINSPPEVQEVSIEPKIAHANDRLKAIVTATDKDRDFIYINYKWEKNGSVLSGETGEVLEQSRFKKGDSIVVIVTPDDREVVGAPKKSQPVIISNSPPVILSSPPTSSEGNMFTYQLKIHDSDDDPVTFFLKKAPKGMEIDKNSGLIRWEIPKESKGSHPIEIEAADTESAKSFQRFTLNVELK